MGIIRSGDIFTYIDPPIHQLPVRTCTHSQECQPSERFSVIGRTGSGRQASRQRPAEELGEEGEEEEQVRLVYFTISKISSCKQLLCVWCRGREQ